MASHVLIIGHSYARHLNSFLRRNDIANLGLDPQKQIVHVSSGVSRRDKINLICQAKHRIVQILGDLPSIDVAIVILGSNDLCHFYLKPAHLISAECYRFGETLINNGVRRVVFVPCLPRFEPEGFSKNCPFYRSRNVWTMTDCVEMFKRRCKVFNDMLSKFTKIHPAMVMANMKGFKGPVQHLLKRGLHLNDVGHAKFLNVLQHEAVFHCNKALGPEGMRAADAYWDPTEPSYMAKLRLMPF